MKPHTLPVKRRPVSKGVLKRLSAVTGNRHQRAATAAAEADADDGSSKISRALTIIFLIHIVAIGLIFVHQKFLDGRAPAGAGEKESLVPVAAAAPRSDLRKLSTGARTYIPRQGDNYARIAKEQGVDEAELRKLNENMDIQSGRLIELPPPRPVVINTVRPADRAQPAATAVSDGLVDAVPVDVRGAPKARAVADSSASATASGSTYKVQSGDSIWRIANRFKVDQNDLMKLNGIADARKMKVGMELKIPN